VVKNKVAVPFKKAEFSIRFGEGIDKLSEIIDIAVNYSIIDKKGSWYSYGDTRLGQGANSVRDILVDNPELAIEIETKIYETLGM
jgi:recombination protein RecA